MKTDDLLQLLSTDSFVSGEELSRSLGVSRSAVWKVIRQLREEGYKIESVTNRGYKLVSSPDVLSEAEIRKGLSTKVLGSMISASQTVDSTNEEAKRQAALGAPHGSIFVADQQTGGKGRLGRVWVSPPGEGIWFTILLRPNDAPVHAAAITLLAGLAVCKGIRNQFGCDAKIKWPNDVVIGSRKVCGILTEMAAEMERIHYIAVGIGINANTPSFPEELQVRATSIALELGHPIRRCELLQEVLLEFEQLYDAYFVQRLPGFIEEYKNWCVTLGRTVSTFHAGKEISGTAIDVTLEGDLVVQLSDETTITVNSGEVTVQGIYGQ